VKDVSNTFDLLEKVAHCTIIYLLSSEASFQLSVPCIRIHLCIISDTVLDSFRIRLVWFQPKQDSDRIRMSFFKNR